MHRFFTQPPGPPPPRAVFYSEFASSHPIFAPKTDTLLARILLIETATEVCSAAIADAGTVRALRETTQPAASQLTLQIEACTAEAGIPLAELDAVAVSAGPGSYTGLRVGASVAKGLCYALNKPLIAVDTLLALAAASRQSAVGSRQSFFLLPMLDARRQEVWTAAYDADLHCLAPAQPLILENNLFEKFLQENRLDTPGWRFVVSGNGAKKMANGSKIGQMEFSPVTANSAAQLAEWAESAFQRKEFQDLAYFEPHYMKPPNITVASAKSLF